MKKRKQTIVICVVQGKPRVILDENLDYPQTWTTIGEAEIDIKCDTLIRELPGPIKYADLGGTKVLFKFHGGRGIVMGMSDRKGT